MRGKVAKKLWRIAAKVSEPTSYGFKGNTRTIVLSGRRAMYQVLKTAWMSGKRKEVAGILR